MMRLLHRRHERVVLAPWYPPGSIRLQKTFYAILGSTALFSIPAALLLLLACFPGPEDVAYRIGITVVPQMMVRSFIYLY